MEPLALEHGITADRHLAAAFEMRVQGALGLDAGARRGIVERREQGMDAGIVGATLDADRALAHGRQRPVRLEPRADAVFKTEALEAGDGEKNGVEVAGVEPGEARVDVAAQHGDLEPAETRRATGTGGAGSRCRRALPRVAPPASRAGSTRRRRADPRARGSRRCAAPAEADRHVLHRVHGDVDAAFEQPLLELLDEQPLAADRGEGAVSRRRSPSVVGGHELDPEPRMQSLQAIADVLRLPQGERAFAGTETQSIQDGLNR